MKQKLLRFLQNYRVRFGTLFFVWILLDILWGDVRPFDPLRNGICAVIWIALLMGITGQSLRLWAAGHIQKLEGLTTTGPYRYVRNPLYIGNYLLGSGCVLLLDDPDELIIFSLLFLFTTIPTVLDEEKVLLEGHGETYRRYLQTTPRWVPDFKLIASDLNNKLTPFGAGFIRNKEYRSVFSYVTLVAFLGTVGHFYEDIRHIGTILKNMVLP
jgi:steroid 5-alpha reductase family enzyme